MERDDFVCVAGWLVGGAEESGCSWSFTDRDGRSLGTFENSFKECIGTTPSALGVCIFEELGSIRLKPACGGFVFATGAGGDVVGVGRKEVEALLEQTGVVVGFPYGPHTVAGVAFDQAKGTGT